MPQFRPRDQLVPHLGSFGRVLVASTLIRKPNLIWTFVIDLPCAINSNDRLWASSAILLHTLPMSAQCDYNAIEGRGLS